MLIEQNRFLTNS